jgi:hypothetical protein
MKFKFLTFSVMLLFTAFSFGTVIQTTNEPHKQMSAVFELFERDEDEDEDE